MRVAVYALNIKLYYNRQRLDQRRVTVEDDKKEPVERAMAQDNHMPEVKKNFTPQTLREVQGNHVPETGQAPSSPPPNPKKK